MAFITTRSRKYFVIRFYVSQYRLRVFLSLFLSSPSSEEVRNVNHEPHEIYYLFIK